MWFVCTAQSSTLALICGCAVIVVETTGPSFSRMTGLVTVTRFASFSLLSALKGDTKRHPLSMTLNSPPNNLKRTVLTHTAAPEVRLVNRAIDPEPGPPCPPPWKKSAH